MIKKSRVAAKPGIPRYEIGTRNRGSVFTSDGATTSDPTSSLREFDGNDDWDCLSPDTALVIFRTSLATGVTIIQLLIHKNYHKLTYPDRDPKTTSGRARAGPKVPDLEHLTTGARSLEADWALFTINCRRPPVAPDRRAAL